MRIIPGTEPIEVEHPVVFIFGQPGIGKTTLGYSAEDPLLLDSDQGAHRAKNRRDTIKVSNWTDINELAEAGDALSPYKTILPDTVGRVLDFLTVQLIADNPKYDRGGGALSLQGFGALKAQFATWVNRIRALGKDVVLLAHAKEEKNGDDMIWRPDVTGGSYAELMKISDFVGFLYMRGKDRVLDFNPTDRWVGKNPAGWKPILLPSWEKESRLLGDLVAKGRDALGDISAASADITRQVEELRAHIDTLTKPEEFDRALKEIGNAAPAVAAQGKQLLWDRAKTLGLTFDKKAQAFTAPTNGNGSGNGPERSEPPAAGGGNGAGESAHHTGGRRGGGKVEELTAQQMRFE